MFQYQTAIPELVLLGANKTHRASWRKITEGKGPKAIKSITNYTNFSDLLQLSLVNERAQTRPSN